MAGTTASGADGANKSQQEQGKDAEKPSTSVSLSFFLRCLFSKKT
jgi:hypothetical protein